MCTVWLIGTKRSTVTSTVVPINVVLADQRFDQVALIAEGGEERVAEAGQQHGQPTRINGGPDAATVRP